MTTNHPANGPVSLDRLHQISEHLQHDTQYSNGGNRAYILADMLKVIDRTIAAFGAEPVGYTDAEELRSADNDIWMWKSSHGFGKDIPLYTAPVVPDDGRQQFESWMLKKWGRDRQEYDFAMGKFLHGENYADSYTRHMWKAWSASRAAMLQAEPVIQPYKLPPNSFTDEDLEMMAHGDNPKSNAYRELLAFRRNSQWIGNDSTNGKPLTSGYIAANSPATPDTWIPVSDRMPEESGRYWCYVEEQNSLGKSHYQWNCSWNGEVWSEKALTGRVTHWMPLPAPPQQEVKP